jgi:hypothetical protein
MIPIPGRRPLQSGWTRVRVVDGAKGASWVVPRGFGRHYARCARDPAPLSVLRDLLGLVGYDASTAYLDRLSLRERVELEVYAMREHASASDNPVQRHPRPSHLPPPWRGHGLRTDHPTLLRAPTEED